MRKRLFKLYIMLKMAPLICGVKDWSGHDGIFEGAWMVTKKNYYKGACINALLRSKGRAFLSRTRHTGANVFHVRHWCGAEDKELKRQPLVLPCVWTSSVHQKSSAPLCMSFSFNFDSRFVSREDRAAT